MREGGLGSLRVATLVVAASMAPLVSTGAAAQSDRPRYESAATCAECHETIHLYWKESAHARAASSPTYVAAREAAAATVPDAAATQRGCDTCHAPTTLVSDDPAMASEGVTCDFCHTIVSVDLQSVGHPFLLDPGPVKRGPLEYASSDFHQTAYSLLHKSSALLCASCHEWKNALGVPVLSTWSEWRESDYATEGRTCQECHMPTVPGESVGEGMTASRRVVNLHRIEGGSSANKLRTGLGLEIAMLGSTSASAQVEVVVRNRGVGHKVPGGLGNDHLVLVVGVDAGSGALLSPQQRVYRRELRDTQGRTLTSIPEMFLQAASVGEDNRIGPGEARRERVTLPLVNGWRAIVARLEFRDASTPDAEPILITEQRRAR